MTNEEIRQFINKYNKKWYYYYNFDGIVVCPSLRKKHDSGLCNWKKISTVIYGLMEFYDKPIILDVGCNMGLYDYEMCKHNGMVIGVDRIIDQSLFFQKYVRENLRMEFDSEFISVDVTKHPLKNFVSSVNIVTMLCVIYHLCPYQDFVMSNLPDHEFVVVQGNNHRLTSKKRKKQELAGVKGISLLLHKHGYDVNTYFNDYSKPLVVGKKK